MAEERILLIQLRQLGDILLTTPCLRAIKRERPRAKLTLLTHSMGRLILDNNPFVDEHFFYEDDWKLAQHVRLAKTLKERAFDLVFDFMGNPRSAIMSFAARGKERVAFSSPRRFAYTHLVPRPGPGRYIVDEKFDLLRATGFRPEGQGLVLPWFEAHTQPVMRLYASGTVLRDSPLRVAISPTHRREARRWPLAAYAALADRLTRELGAACIFLWGPGEEAEVERCRVLCQTPTWKAPKTSFRELAALVGNLDLFIGNSNGPSHVAVATDICSLQLHGPTRGLSWCPDVPKHRFVQAPTKDMASLSVDAVWEALQAMLGTVRLFAAEHRAKGLKVSWRL